MTVSVTKNKMPAYTGDGVTRNWDFDFPILNVDDMKVYVVYNDVTTLLVANYNVDLLNNYVISKMEERGLTDTKESYEQIINEVFGLLGIEDNTTSENKFNKIVQYINFLNRANDAKKTRDAMKKYLKNN